MKMRKNHVLFLIFGLAVLSVFVVNPSALAEMVVTAENESAKNENADKYELIQQNCESIKLQLKRTQKDDARLRVTLGSYYESVSVRHIQALNLRMINNNLSYPDFVDQQAAFASERERFKNDYIGYSQEMDKLLAIKCSESPEKFYTQLQKTQQKREDVYKSTKRLRGILKNHIESTKEFQKELSDDK